MVQPLLQGFVQLIQGTMFVSTQRVRRHVKMDNIQGFDSILT
ncbi:unnamed protein product [Brassica oleracea var. botrytis]